MLCPIKFNPKTVDENGRVLIRRTVGSHKMDPCQCERARCAWWIGGETNMCAEVALARATSTSVDLYRLIHEELGRLRGDLELHWGIVQDNKLKE